MPSFIKVYWSTFRVYLTSFYSIGSYNTCFLVCLTLFKRLLFDCDFIYTKTNSVLSFFRSVVVTWYVRSLFNFLFQWEYRAFWRGSFVVFLYLHMFNSEGENEEAARIYKLLLWAGEWTQQLSATCSPAENQKFNSQQPMAAHDQCNSSSSALSDLLGQQVCVHTAYSHTYAKHSDT